MAYLATEGAPTSGWATSPDSAPVTIAGDIDVRIRLAADAYDTVSTPFAQSGASSTTLSWRLVIRSNGVVRFLWRSGGSNVSHDSAAHGLSAAEATWFRATLDVNNGAGGYDLRFWLADGSLEAPDAADFSQLGTTITGGSTTSIDDSTEDITIGALSDGSSAMNGKVWRAQIYDGIDGTLVFDADFSDPTTWTFS